MDKVTLKELIVGYLDSLEMGQRFSPREVRDHIYMVTGGERNPMDGTVTRIMRKLREEGYAWSVYDHAKSIYIKGEGKPTGGVEPKKKKGPKPYTYRY